MSIIDSALKRRYPNRRTRGNRRCSRRARCIYPRTRNERDHAPQQHRLRITTFTDDESNSKLGALTGDTSPAPMRFFSYEDPEKNTREQIKTVRSHPWIAKDVPVRGFVFDMETRLLSEVQAVPEKTAAQVSEILGA
jgi:carbonic anhydrase